MTLKIYHILFLLIFTLTAATTRELPSIRATFGFEYLTPEISPEHNYNTATLFLDAELKFKHDINQEKNSPGRVKFVYELLYKFNKLKHTYANVSRLMGYRKSEVTQVRNSSAPDITEVVYLKPDK